MSNETELKDFLKKETAASRRGAKILLIVGIVVVVVIVGYFSYILSYLKSEWQAEDFIDVAFHQVDQAIDNYIPQAEGFVLEQVPELMDEARKRLPELVPKLRGQAEDIASDQLDALAERVHDALSDEIQQILLTHGPQVRHALSAVNDIERANAKRELQAVLEEEFEKTAVNELDPYLPEVLQAFKEMDADIEVLVETPVEQLSERQKLERELLQIFYTLFSRFFADIRG